VASLTGIFKTEPEAPQDTDKLVDLFRNRSELKKEFAALRNEKYQLQDRIKERQGAVERVQQKLGHLEALLLDPEWVHNVVAFYQLRRLAVHCENKIARFAEQLKRQREERVYSKVLATWTAQLEKESAKVERKIGEVRMRLQLLEDQLQAERHKLATMGGISKMFHGRSQESAVNEIEASIAKAQGEEQALLLELERIGNSTPPDQEGLDTAAKRSINFMILSFAQQLYLDYTEDNLAGLAKEASEKSVGAINYGSKADCDELLEILTKRREDTDQRDDFVATLQKRAKLIAEHALFRNDDDVVPAPGTVATIYDIDANGVVRQSDANLLGENYFAVAKVLSR
jgi:predicted nuclease with TOPRIM domain